MHVFVWEDIMLMINVFCCLQQVEETPCGHEANLWEKFLGGKTEQRFICFTKADKVSRTHYCTCMYMYTSGFTCILFHAWHDMSGCKRECVCVCVCVCMQNVNVLCTCMITALTNHHNYIVALQVHVHVFLYCSLGWTDCGGLVYPWTQ